MCLGHTNKGLSALSVKQATWIFTRTHRDELVQKWIDCDNYTMVRLLPSEIKYAKSRHC